MKRRGLYKSPHAGFAVKVRSGLEHRHPTTGHIIGTTPAVWAFFGEPTGTVQITNPLTGEEDVVETYRGGTFDVNVAGEENGWDDDIKQMVCDVLDRQCELRPAQIQRIDYVIPPAEKPWPTYDGEPVGTDEEVEALVATAVRLGLVGKTIAYERENRDHSKLIDLLDEALHASPDPAPEPEPNVAAKPERRQAPELTKVAIL